MPAFTACFAEARYEQHLQNDLQLGIEAGVRGTPTYILNGTKIEGSITKEQWDTLIVAALNSDTQ